MDEQALTRVLTTALRSQEASEVQEGVSPGLTSLATTQAATFPAE